MSLLQELRASVPELKQFSDTDLVRKIAELSEQDEEIVAGDLGLNGDSYKKRKAGAVASDIGKTALGSGASALAATPLGLEIANRGFLRGFVEQSGLQAADAASRVRGLTGENKAAQEDIALEGKDAAQAAASAVVDNLDENPINATRKALFEQLAEKGKAVQEELESSMSSAGQRLKSESTPSGNLLKGEIDFGENPTVAGYALQVASVLGTMAPTILAGVAAGPAAGAAVGGGMAAGEAATSAKDYFDKLNHEQLAEVSPAYQMLIDSGETPDRAKAIIAEQAAEAAAIGQGMIGAFGGAATSAILRGALDKTVSAIGSRVGRAGAIGAASGAEEAAQEVAEGIASDIGIRSQDTTKEIGEDSAANALLGFAGGAGPGAARGLGAPRAQQDTQPNVQPDTAQRPQIEPVPAPQAPRAPRQPTPGRTLSDAAQTATETQARTAAKPEQLSETQKELLAGEAQELSIRQMELQALMGANEGAIVPQHVAELEQTNARLAELQRLLAEPTDQPKPQQEKDDAVLGLGDGSGGRAEAGGSSSMGEPPSLGFPMGMVGADIGAGGTGYAGQPTRTDPATAVDRDRGPADAALSEQSPRNEPPQNEVGGLDVVEIPVDGLRLSEDVPQFKQGANQEGVVEPLGGTFDRRGVAPIQVWERADGRREVISGRHRLDLARRSGEQTIPAQIHREADGFTVEQAKALDAELNIRDGQGKAIDYVDYFKAQGITREQAAEEGLVARNPGRRAFEIAASGSEETIAALRAGRISETDAERLVTTAPGDQAVQALGLEQLQAGKSGTAAEAVMQAAQVLRAERGADSDAEQGDMFDFDDSAIKEAEKMGRIAARKKREVNEDLSAIRGANKKPEVAAKYGINIKDKKALDAKVAELRARAKAWDKWPTNPELVAEVRDELTGATKQPDAKPQPAAQPTAPKTQTPIATAPAGDTGAAQSTADATQADTGAKSEAAAPETQLSQPLPTDKLKSNGQPFASEAAAKRAAKARNISGTHNPVAVDGGWVLRRSDQQTNEVQTNAEEVQEQGKGAQAAGEVAAPRKATDITDAEYKKLVDDAAYLKDFTYSASEVVGSDKKALLAISRELSKSGRDTLLMDAFNIERDLAHTINNGLDDRQPKKLRAVDMERAFELFPGLLEIVDGAKEKSEKQADEKPNFTLTKESEADIKAREDAQRTQAEADAKAKDEEQKRAQADAELGSFSLSGSDRAEDVAGQKAMFDLTTGEVKAEEQTKPFTQTHIASDGEPLQATDEPNLYLDRDGNEVEDEAARAVEVGAEKKEAVASDSAEATEAPKTAKVAEVASFDDYFKQLQEEKIGSYLNKEVASQHHDVMMLSEIFKDDIEADNFRKHIGRQIDDLREGVLRNTGKRAIQDYGSFRHVEGKITELYKRAQREGKLIPDAAREKHPWLDYINDISLGLATRAYQGTSHIPDTRGRAIVREYAESLAEDRAAMEAAAKKGGTEAQLDEVFENYRAGLKKRYEAMLHAQTQLMSTMIAGPAKFPVRRQEKRNATANKRTQELIDWKERARNKAIRLLENEQPATRADTVAFFKDRIAKLEAEQQRMKDANKVLRSKKATDDEKVSQLQALGFSQDDASKLLKPDFAGRMGFSYQLSNNNAAIKRSQARLNELEAREQEAEQATETKFTFDGGFVELDYDADRLRIHHEQKPDADTIAKFKKNGFRWSPANKAWQRQLTDNAKRAASQLTGVSFEQAAKQADNDIRASRAKAKPTGVTAQQDREYLAAVERGDMETAQQMVAEAAEASGLPIINEEGVTAYKVRRTAPPKKTAKAYKLFRTKKTKKGEVFALFVGASDPLPQGTWLDAIAGPQAPDSKTGKQKVKSKLGPLAYRPGWHAGDLPLATHIGAKDADGNVFARKDDEVWAEVDMAYDNDYQAEAEANGTRPDGTFVVGEADIKKMPVDGLYRYKTNPNMTGKWIISGSMKINRILSEDEVNAILKGADQKVMPWASLPKGSKIWQEDRLDLSRWGLDTNPARNQKKLLDPVTYDDNGNVIPLSQRFNAESNDPRYDLGGLNAPGISTYEAKDAVDAALSKLPNAPAVRVVRNPGHPDVPEAVLKKEQTARRSGAGASKGVYVNGQVFLFADNLASVDEAIETALHEIIGHDGLRKVFGDALNPVLDQVIDARRKAVLAKAKEYGLGNTRDDLREAADELIAEMAEKNPDLGFVKRVVAAIRKLLSDMGVTMRLSDNDIIYRFILPSRAYQEGKLGEAARGRLQRAETVRASRVSGLPDTIDVDGKQRPTTNSNGQPIHTTEEGIRNFWKWFGESKVVDGKGRPLVMYHGTNQDFSTFREGPSWFTSVPEDAFSGGRAGASVVPAYLKIELPQRRAEYFGMEDFSRPEKYKWYDKDQKQWVQPDGIIGNNGHFVVFDGTSQIKSATGNTGTFDGANPDIRFSRKTAPQRARPQQITLNGNLSQQPVKPNPYQAAKARAVRNTAGAKWDTFIYTIQDKFIDLKRIQQGIQALDGTLTDLNNAYQGEELFHKRLAKRTKNFQERELKPLLKAINDSGLNIETLERYLHARHAPEANRILAERNPNEAELENIRDDLRKTVDELRLDLQRARKERKATGSIETALKLAREELADWNKAKPYKGTEEERLALSGMSDAEAEAFMDELSDENRAKLASLAEKVDAMQEKTLDTLVQYDLMPKETIETWRDTYQHYVPLHRDEAHEDSTSHPIGQGYQAKGDASKARVGSTEKVTNILAHIAMQREAALTRGEKNRVAKQLYTLIAQNPDPDIWTIGQWKMKSTLDRKTKTVVQVPDGNYKNQPNVLTLRIGGKDRIITFNEKNERAMRLAKTLKNMEVGDLHWAMGAFAKYSRFISAINTQYNPIFGVVNFARDVQAATLQLSTTPLRGKEAQVLAATTGVGNKRGALQAIWRAERGKTPKDSDQAQMMALWEDMQMAGGSTGYRDMFADAKERTKKLQAEIRQMSSKNAVAKVFRGTAELLSNYNEAMENAVRLGAYKVAIENGISREQAASIAKNLTVNFNRKGAAGREANALYAFFNAAVQGTTRMVETLKGPPGKTIISGGIMAGALQTLVGMMMIRSDDDDDETLNGWYSIPEFVRERSFIIPLGGTEYLTIPMPLGYNVIPNIGRKVVEAAMGAPATTPGEQAVDGLLMIANAFNPLGGGGNLAQTLSPTPSDIPIALLGNRDWTNRPIAQPNFSGLDPRSGPARGRDGASPIGKSVSSGINAMTGGTPYAPGWLGDYEPTPDQIDYVLGQLTGGVGREFSKALTTAAVWSGISNDELPPYKIPLAGRFYGSVSGQTGASDIFYKNVKELNKIRRNIKGARNDRDQKAYERYISDPLAKLAANNIQGDRQRRVSELRDMREQLKREKPEGWRDRVDALNERITELMQDLNRRVAEAQSQ